MLYYKEYSLLLLFVLFLQEDELSYIEVTECSLGRVKLHCTMGHSRNSRSLKKNTKSKELDRKNGLMKQRWPANSFFPTIIFIQQLNRSLQFWGEKLALAAHILVSSSHFSCTRNHTNQQ